VIGRRLNRLSGECNRVLALAAVIGRDFELQVLEQLAEMPGDRLLELLQEATAAHVIAEVPRRAGHYAFSHALIRETLYEELSSLRRVQLHRRVGEVLERLHGSGDAHLPELAYHFYAAAPGGDSERAVDYAARAGARATARLAYEEAAGHYRRALELLDVGGHADETRHSDLLLAQADAEMGAGDTVAARDTFLRAARLARRSGMPDQLARAALGLGTGLQGFWGYGAGFVDELVVSLLEESLAELGASDSPLRALLLGRLAVALYWSPVPERREPIRRLGTDAVEMARRVADPTVELVSLASRHWADWRPENVGERLAAAEGVLRLAARLGHREMSLLGHAFHLADSLELGNVAAADADLEAFARLAEEVRQPRYAWWSTMFRTMRSLLAGRFAEGERLAGEALTTGQKAQASDAAQTFGVHMYTIRREQGGLDELAAATQALGDQYRTIPTWRCGVALLLAEAGRMAEARRELDALAARDFAELPRDLVWLTSMALLAETAALLDDGPRAAVLHEQLAPYGDRCIVIPYGIACFGSASRPLGLLASTLRRWPEAEQHFEAALAVNRRMGARPWVARTERDYAAMLLARGRPGDRERAGALCAHASATADELGMARLAEQIARLQDGGGSVTAAPPASRTSSVARAISGRWRTAARPAV
jgi:tetratricopeptide (TPR) repeat protein